jgi:hypothetical protein
MHARLLDAARELLDALHKSGRPACLIGGMVVSRWGDPRATQDVDATVWSDFGEERTIVEALTSTFRSRDADPFRRAELGRLVLLSASNGVKIDLSLAAFPFEQEVLRRATPWRVLSDCELMTCSAEDLVIYKLVAARPQDLADVDSVVRRQARRLDADRIRQWGAIFAELKEDIDLLQPFEDALTRLPRR